MAHQARHAFRIRLKGLQERRDMDIQQILRWIVMAIVLMVAVALLGVILKFTGVLLQVALKILLFLLLTAIVVRFISLLRERRH